MHTSCEQRKELASPSKLAHDTLNSSHCRDTQNDVWPKQQLRLIEGKVTLEWRYKYSLTIVCVTPSWSSWTRWSSATRLRQREVKSLATNFQPPLYRGQLWRLFIFRVWRRATPASRSATTRTLSKVTTTRRSASSSPVIPSLAGEPTTAAMKRGLYDINHSTKNILNVYNHTVL